MYPSGVGAVGVGAGGGLAATGFIFAGYAWAGVLLLVVGFVLALLALWRESALRKRQLG